MIQLKKYILLVLMVGLCSNFLHSMDWGIDIPSAQDVTHVSEGGSALMKFVSDALSENPILGVAISAGAVVLGGLFVNRGKIYTYAEKKYAECKKETSEEVKISEGQISTVVNFRNRMRMFFLNSIIGFPTHLYSTKWHILAAAIMGFTGKFFGHPWIGGTFGGGAVAWGFATRLYSGLKKDIDEVHQSVKNLAEENRKEHEKTREENKREHSETRKEFSAQLDTTKEELKGQINETKIELIEQMQTGIGAIKKELRTTEQNITAQLQKIKNQTDINTNVVGGKIETLREQFKDVPEKIADLITQFQNLNDKENERVLAIKQSIAEIKQQCITTQQKFSDWDLFIVTKMTAMEGKLTIQEANIAQVLENNTKTNELMTSLQRKQELNSDYLLKLTQETSQINETNQEKIQFLLDLGKSWKENVNKFQQAMRDWEVTQKNSIVQIQNVYSTMDTRMCKMEDKMEVRNQEESAKMAVMQSTIETLILGQKSQEEMIASLNKKIDSLNLQLKKTEKTLLEKLSNALQEITSTVKGTVTTAVKESVESVATRLLSGKRPRLASQTDTNLDDLTVHHLSRQELLQLTEKEYKS